MKFGVFTNPASPGVISEGEKLRPIGRNNEGYQQMLDELMQAMKSMGSNNPCVMPSRKAFFNS